MTGHSMPVYAVAFSPKGKRVVSRAFDNIVKIWNAETGAEVSSFVGVC
jgi:WD40 repeat protein